MRVVYMYNNTNNRTFDIVPHECKANTDALAWVEIMGRGLGGLRPLGNFTGGGAGNGTSPPQKNQVLAPPFS